MHPRILERLAKTFNDVRTREGETAAALRFRIILKPHDYLDMHRLWARQYALQRSQST